MRTNNDLQAAEKGSTPVITGVIIGCAPLCVFLFAPVFGYYVRFFMACICCPFLSQKCEPVITVN